MKSNSVPMLSHLYQLYPNIPKYANDPQQSDIIRVYDLLLKRFQGIYGREPKYFIRSPATCPTLGSISQCIDLSVVSMCSGQNIIISIALNGHQQLRFNNFQNAVHGQKIFDNQSQKWKYDDKNDQYSNILLASLKTYSVMANVHTLPGIDVLIYSDFVQDDHLNSRQAVCLGIATALHTVTEQKGAINSQFCYKYLQKLANLLHSIKPTDFAVISSYGNVCVSNRQKKQQKQVQFPKDMDIIFAHSMTPLPKKMTTGKRQNLRACEVAIGIEIIKNQIGAINNISSLNELKRYLNCSTKQLLQTLDQYVPKQELTGQKIEQFTQKSLIQILKSIPFANNVIDQNLTFKPYNRIKFSLLEQLSIENLSTENYISTIKQSFQRSQQFLQIGSQQFDDIIKIIINEAEAWKIVGDGWGGYLMIICQSKKTTQIVQKLVNQFYMNPQNRVLLSDDVDQYINIVGKPGNGLSILDPSSEIWYC